VLVMLVGQVERSPSLLVGLLYVIEFGRQSALLKFRVQCLIEGVVVSDTFTLTVTKSLS
jgi:hypothetical protein